MKFDIIDDKWLLIKNVGKGAFSHIYAGYNIMDQSTIVAIKTQALNCETGGILRGEAEVLMNLSQNQDKYDYIIMEYLSGEDMSHLRDRIRSNQHFIPAPVVIYLTKQMLTCLKHMHVEGLIHRDVKPSNFVRKNLKCTKFKLVDFGIAKKFRENDGTLKPKRSKAPFRGTSRYASANAHNEAELSPLDDLYSLFFVFVDLLCGTLPWADALSQKNKEKVGLLKNEYVEDTEAFVKWISDKMREQQQSYQVPEDSQPSMDFEKNCLNILNHLKGLNYGDKPDYDLIEENLLAINPSGVDINAVEDINFKHHDFSWMHEHSDDPISKIVLPIEVQLQVLQCKVIQLKLDFEDHRPTCFNHTKFSSNQSIAKKHDALNDSIRSCSVESQSYQLGDTPHLKRKYSETFNTIESNVDNSAKDINNDSDLLPESYSTCNDSTEAAITNDRYFLSTSGTNSAQPTTYAGTLTEPCIDRVNTATVHSRVAATEASTKVTAVKYTNPIAYVIKYLELCNSYLELIDHRNFQIERGDIITYTSVKDSFSDISQKFLTPFHFMEQSSDENQVNNDEQDWGYLMELHKVTFDLRYRRDIYGRKKSLRPSVGNSRRSSGV